jgi:asparagine synthase (glutamine-hydrolysing)
MAEPVGDFSIVPTTLLTGFAADRVTVALSGDGGDELFHGYERPWSLLRSGAWFRAPRTVRRGRYYAGRALPRVVPPVSEAITATSPGAYYRSVNSRSGALRHVLGPDLPAPPGLWWYETPTRLDRAGLVDLSRTAEYHGQLQRVLRKVDLASMHHSLEVRVPVLSRAVVELSGSVDADFCLRAGQRKGPLRDLLARRVPGVAQQQIKQGFTPPLNRWIDGPLRARIEAQMAEPSWHLDDHLDPGALRRLADPATPARHWNLWTILALEWWLGRLAALPRPFDPEPCP